MQKTFFIFFFLFLIIFVKAQVIDTIEILTPVEVRSIRANARAPFALTNVQQKDILKNNFGANLPYLLNQTPSVVVSSDDGLGVGYSAMRIRGTDLTRTNFTINGIPVNDPESQGVFFVNFGDLASASSSIQIQRGVGSSTNGAGAFGASVSISNAEQSLVPFAEVSNAYGSYNTWKHTVRAGSGMLKGGFQVDARLSKISSDGYIYRSNSNLKSLQLITGWTSKNQMSNLKFNMFTGTEKTGQAWNGLEVYFSEEDTKATFNYRDTLTSIGRRSNLIGKMGTDTNGNPIYYNDQTDNYQQDYYQLFYNQKWNKHWSSNVALFMTRGRGYYNEYKRKQSYSDYGLPNYVKAVGDTLNYTDLVRQLWLDNYYYGTVFSTNYKNEKTDLTLGGAYSKYDAKHYGYVTWASQGVPSDYRYYYYPNSHKNDFNIFAKLQQALTENLYGYLDLQYRNVYYSFTGSRKNPDLLVDEKYHFFNPKAGLSYYIFHSNLSQSKIYGSFAIANREPNRNDFEGAQKDKKPLPETLYDYELGYQFNASKANAGLNLYYMNYKNQLILTGQINDVGEYTRMNVDKSYRMGVEITAGYKPSNWIQLSANASFSQNKIKELNQYFNVYDNSNDWGWLRQESVNYTNSDIAFSPNIVVGGIASLEPFFNYSNNNHFYIDILEKYVGRQYLDNSSDIMRSIDPYALADARLRYELKPSWIKELNVVLLLNNLFNKKYENNGFTYSSHFVQENYTMIANGYYPQAGFNFNFGITLGF